MSEKYTELLSSSFFIRHSTYTTHSQFKHFKILIFTLLGFELYVQF